MQVPDVTAFRLDRAVERLDQQGINYYLKKVVARTTAAVISVQCQPQNYRVVKQVMDQDGLLELTVAPEMD